MTQKNKANIRVEEMVSHLEAKIKKREHTYLYTPKQRSSTQQNPLFIKKEIYEYPDFSRYNGKEFIANLYKGLLLREVDPQGLEYYLELLKTCKRTKDEIITSIRYSKEGRVKAVKLLGSKKRYLLATIFKIPIFGNFIKWLFTMLTLPKTIQLMDQKEAYASTIIDELRDETLDLKDLLQSKVDKIDLQDLKDLLQSKADKIDLQDLIQSKADKTDLQDLKDLLQSKADKIDLQDLLQSKADKTDLDKKVSHKELDLYIQTVSYAKEYMKISQQQMQNLIDEAKKRLPTEIFNQKELLTITQEQQHKFDTFYAEFEDRFRGSTKDIKKRLEVYLPYLEELPFEKQNIQALDIGCGRGEWLELLQEHNYKNVKGLDLNHIMVARSQALGLDVVQSDVIEYLKTQEDESLSLISGFHIIEHLSFEVLMELFAQSYRVLQKGGMLIFETPNAENLLVGAHSFYTDPTHKNPIPYASSEFFAKYVGFQDTQILRLHYPQNQNFENVLLNHHMCVGHDYALLGYKR